MTKAPHDLNITDDQSLTIELCRQIIHDEVFRFQPKDYCKKYPKWPGMVGFEIEMMPFVLKSNSLMPLYGEGSSTALLARNLGEGDTSWRPSYIKDDPHEGMMQIALDQGDQITFEPGGQIEFSSKPYPCLSDAILRVNEVQQRLNEMFNPEGVNFLQAGMNPIQSVGSIGLQMKKPRYLAMDRHFAAISPFGQQMMRQTCSIQVNLDFGATRACMAKRYLLANLVAPIATAIFANSPLEAGHANEKGYASLRGRVWQNLDPSRTGFPSLQPIAQNLDQEACVDAYLNHVLDARVVYVESLAFETPVKAMTFRQWIQSSYKGVAPTRQDFATHLSLHFPEVRPKGFLEVRSVDGLPRYWQVVPAAFYTALLYDDRSLEAGLEFLVPHLAKLQIYWQNCLFGYRDQEIKSLIKGISPLVLEGFERLPSCFLGEGTKQRLYQYWDHYVSKSRTPADELKEQWQRDASVASLLKLEASWQNSL